jgi:hypothetical protein
MWLVGSMCLSFALHFVILHVEVLSVSYFSLVSRGGLAVIELSHFLFRASSK